MNTDGIPLPVQPTQTRMVKPAQDTDAGACTPGPGGASGQRLPDCMWVHSWHGEHTGADLLECAGLN